MRREHSVRTKELTRFALTQGYSQSLTTNGDTVTLSRDGGRGSEFCVTHTKREGTTIQTFERLSHARKLFYSLAHKEAR